MIKLRMTNAGRRYDVRLRDPSGRVYNRTFLTKREAELYVAHQRTDRSRGAWVDPRKGTVTVESWATTWLAQRTDLRPRTHELYEGLLRLHVVPELGAIEVAKLSPSQVRSWHARLRGPEGPGATTAAKTYRLLRSILHTAVVDEVIVRNPCQVARAGIEHAPERPVASVADVAALADAISPRFRLVLLLGAWCGLRRGEVLALRRTDIGIDSDRNVGVVRVERSIQQRADGTLDIGPPKTAAGRRTVAIPPHLLAEVVTHLERYAALAPDSLVFTGEKGGPVRPHVLQKAWVAAREATGLTQLHLHDLRHAGNTWAAATGASTRELMARMGHASAQAALRYQHATAERDQAIAAALSDLVPADPPTSAAR